MRFGLLPDSLPVLCTHNDCALPDQPESQEYEETRQGEWQHDCQKYPAQACENNSSSKVTFFDDSKGYGFIIDSETNEKVFVHINNTLEEIGQDDKVSFEIEKGLKGPAATNVKLHKEE